MTTTFTIVSDFVALVDTDKEYGLAEIKAVLSNAFKAVLASKKPVKVAKVAKAPGAPKKAKNSSDDESVASSENEKKPRKKSVKRERDADGNIIKKRLPSAYNLFVAEKIAEFKKENPALDSKEAFKLAIGAWNEQKANKAAEPVEVVEAEEDNE